MATNLTISQGQQSLAWTFTSDDAFGGKIVSNGTDLWKFGADLTNGTGANQASKMYVAKRTLAGGANETLDLAGSLTDQFGSTITFTAVKGLKISLLTDTTASSILVGNTGANGWLGLFNATTDAVKIRNGYSFAVFGTDAAGMAVTAGTGDLLKVLNQDGANVATYTILVYGI
jgi:hypothetical protein